MSIKDNKEFLETITSRAERKEVPQIKTLNQFVLIVELYKLRNEVNSSDFSVSAIEKKLGFRHVNVVLRNIIRVLTKVGAVKEIRSDFSLIKQYKLDWKKFEDFMDNQLVADFYWDFFLREKKR